MKRVLSAMLIVVVLAVVSVAVIAMLLKQASAPAGRRRGAPKVNLDGRLAGYRGPATTPSAPAAEQAETAAPEQPSDEAPEETVEETGDIWAPASEVEKWPEDTAQNAPSPSGAVEAQEEVATPHWDDFAGQNGTGALTASAFPPPVIPAGEPLEPGDELESESSGEAEPPEDQAAAAGEAGTLENEAVQPEAEVPLLESVEEALNDAPAMRAGGERNAESYLDEGNVYFNVGQYRLAIERYTSAIALSDTLVAAFYNRANAHTRNGEYEEALGDYDRALELEPRDADALNNRGMLHLYRANYAAALDDFDAALKLDPHDTTVMVNRGLAYLHSGNAVSALVDFQEAASLDSEDAAAHYGAAQAAAMLKNRASAMRHLRRALELDGAYAREAAGDPNLELLQGSEDFLRLLRESGSRSGRSA